MPILETRFRSLTPSLPTRSCASVALVCQYNRIFLYERIVHPVPQVFNLPLIVPELIASWSSERHRGFLLGAATCETCRAEGAGCVNGGCLGDCLRDCFGDRIGGERVVGSAHSSPTGSSRSARQLRANSKEGAEPSKQDNAAAAAERVHMETFLATRLEEERRTVKGIATSTRDAVNGLAGDQARALDLLQDINETIETAIVRQQDQRGPQTARGPRDAPERSVNA